MEGHYCKRRRRQFSDFNGLLCEPAPGISVVSPLDGVSAGLLVLNHVLDSSQSRCIGRQGVHVGNSSWIGQQHRFLGQAFGSRAEDHDCRLSGGSPH